MVSLQDKHSFRIPVYARDLIKVTSLDQLRDLPNTQDLWILGEGTNTIFTEDFDGSVLWVQLLGIEVQEESDAWILNVGSGENWHALVEYTLARNMPGLENLALIPGSVGAAPVQNIGAYGVELSEFVVSVEGYDLDAQEMRRLQNAACEFNYRESIFKTSQFSRFVITSVQLRLPKSWSPRLNYPDLADLSAASTPEAVMQRVIEVRQRKLPDPQQIPNAGSFFKNPILAVETVEGLRAQYPNLPVFPIDAAYCKVPAGWLIDKAGLKAMQVGDAGVHQNQALVLVNRGSATGQDITELAHKIIAQVYDIYGIRLEPEVRLLNSFGLIPKAHWWHHGA
ncbi:UDP-N-acetylmuramate dehydrogenase [Aliidiomarina indica]|uniref:UDP-N-acetylmuramate dehydrogenase n=1 Tax=Aliidiomarina indica TaxID=2749147 RepID=UPI001E33C93D|nr:UDP-N-acetylmuramate dehydrogenase [Aliidiomarina indica]